MKELPIRIAPELGDSSILRDGIVYVGSLEALRRALEEAAPFVIVHTSPPTLMNKETGQLMDADDELVREVTRLAANKRTR